MDQVEDELNSTPIKETRRLTKSKDALKENTTPVSNRRLNGSQVASEKGKEVNKLMEPGLPKRNQISEEKGDLGTPQRVKKIKTQKSKFEKPRSKKKWTTGFNGLVPMPDPHQFESHFEWKRDMRNRLLESLASLSSVAN
jgi:hypothetical protein